MRRNPDQIDMKTATCKLQRRLLLVPVYAGAMPSTRLGAGTVVETSASLVITAQGIEGLYQGTYDGSATGDWALYLSETDMLAGDGNHAQRVLLRVCR